MDARQRLRACAAAQRADNDAMTRDGNGKKPSKAKQTGGRSARLAAALRENLRRRKAQERQRSAPHERGTAISPSGTPDKSG